MATWTNNTSNTSSFTNNNLSAPFLTKQLLMIDDTYFILIDDTNKLEIQSDAPGTTWTNNAVS